MKSWFARHMPLNMPIRSLFVRATSFKFNGPTPNLSNGYGVVDRMGKKNGFIEVFCRNPIAMGPQSPIIQRENLPDPRGERGRLLQVLDGWALVELEGSRVGWVPEGVL